MGKEERCRLQGPVLEEQGCVCRADGSVDRLLISNHKVLQGPELVANVL